MKRALLPVLALTLVMASVTVADASFYLRYSSVFKGDGYIRVLDGSTVHTTSAGIYTLDLDNDDNHATYTTHSNFVCLDLEHNAGYTWWKADLHILPPNYQPGNPPPWNLWLAGWAYQTYRNNAGNDWGAALQLALWEMTHETDWATNYNAASWHDTGNFQLFSDYTTGAKTNATTILTAAKDQPLYPSMDRYVEYYEPADNSSPGTYGQGMLKDGGEIPEPSSLLLLGSIVLAAAGLTWRRRSR